MKLHDTSLGAHQHQKTIIFAFAKKYSYYSHLYDIITNISDNRAT